jgi:hypothetical protein
MTCSHADRSVDTTPAGEVPSVEAGMRVAEPEPPKGGEGGVAGWQAPTGIARTTSRINAGRARHTSNEETERMRLGTGTSIRIFLPVGSCPQKQQQSFQVGKRPAFSV